MTFSLKRYFKRKINNNARIIFSTRTPFMFTTFFHDAPFGRSKVGRRDKRRDRQRDDRSMSRFMQNETKFAHQLSIV